MTLVTDTRPLSAGVYRLRTNGPASSVGVPGVIVSVGDGWESLKGFAIHRGPAGAATVAIQTWQVGQIYREPCQWEGTKFDPGPSVDDLATALAARPLRNASAPVPVTVGGYSGKYLEWSVPADADFNTCDMDAGTHYFESWAGTADGDRYQQAPGQVDQLWILDVNGFRLVIDAFIMPGATTADRDELSRVIKGITIAP